MEREDEERRLRREMRRIKRKKEERIRQLILAGLFTAASVIILAAVIVLLCTVFSTLWINDQRAQELGDIDSAILSDELPIGAFTDKGFAAWLDNKSSSQ